MFKKFITVTTLATASLLSSNIAFADNSVLSNDTNVESSIKINSLLKEYKEIMVTGKNIEKENNIRTTFLNKNLVYSFGQNSQIHLNENLLKENNISKEHVDFLSNIVETHNLVFSKGYFPVESNLEVQLGQHENLLYFDADLIQQRYNDYKLIEDFNKNIDDRVQSINKRIESIEANYEEKLLNNRAISELSNKEFEEHNQKINDLMSDNLEVSQLKKEKNEIFYSKKVSQDSFISKNAYFISKNIEQFSPTLNPSKIFTFNNSNVVNENKSVIYTNPYAQKHQEQCFVFLTSDKNGDILNTFTLADKAGTIYSSIEEKKMLEKFVLIHENSHCHFVQTDIFKGYDTGFKKLDEHLNFMYNSQNKNRFHNKTATLLQENFADTYAFMILLREEKNEASIKNLISMTKDARAYGMALGDKAHYTSYSLEQLENPEIIDKIKNSSIEELPQIAMNIAQKGLGKSLMNSKSIQDFIATSDYTTLLLEAALDSSFDNQMTDKDKQEIYKQLNVGSAKSLSQPLYQEARSYFDEKFSDSKTKQAFQTAMLNTESLFSVFFKTPQSPSQKMYREYTPNEISALSNFIQLQNNYIQKYQDQHSKIKDVIQIEKVSMAKLNINSTINSIQEVQSNNINNISHSKNLLSIEGSEKEMKEKLITILDKAEKNRINYLNDFVKSKNNSLK